MNILVYAVSDWYYLHEVVLGGTAELRLVGGHRRDVHLCGLRAVVTVSLKVDRAVDCVALAGV